MTKVLRKIFPFFDSFQYFIDQSETNVISKEGRAVLNDVDLRKIFIEKLYEALDEREENSEQNQQIVVDLSEDK